MNDNKQQPLVSGNVGRVNSGGSLLSLIREYQPQCSKLCLRGAYDLEKNTYKATRTIDDLEGFDVIRSNSSDSTAPSTWKMNTTPTEELLIGPGVCLIFGPDNSGKSELIRSIARSNPMLVQTLKMIEPSGIQENAMTSERRLFERLLQTTAPIITLDSARYWYYSKADNTGERGVNMDVFTSVTIWNELMLSVNRLLFIVINPMVGGTPEQVEERMLQVASNCRGAVSHAIQCREYGVIKYSSYASGFREWEDKTLVIQQSGSNVKPTVHSVPNVNEVITQVSDADLDGYQLTLAQLNRLSDRHERDHKSTFLP